jgi:hypothetical protein
MDLADLLGVVPDGLLARTTRPDRFDDLFHDLLFVKLSRSQGVCDAFSDAGVIGYPMRRDSC